MDLRVDEFVAAMGAFLACLLEFTSVHLLSTYVRPFGDYLVSFFPQSFPPGWMDPTPIYGLISDMVVFVSVFAVYFAIIFAVVVAIHRAAD